MVDKVLKGRGQGIPGDANFRAQDAGDGQVPVWSTALKKWTIADQSGGGGGGGVPTTRNIIAGTGLTGGGDLSADVTISLDTSGASTAVPKTHILSRTEIYSPVNTANSTQLFLDECAVDILDTGKYQVTAFFVLNTHPAFTAGDTTMDLEIALEFKDGYYYDDVADDQFINWSVTGMSNDGNTNLTFTPVNPMYQGRSQNVVPRFTCTTGGELMVRADGFVDIGASDYPSYASTASLTYRCYTTNNSEVLASHIYLQKSDAADY